MFYAKVHLIGGGTYIQPLDKLTVFMDEVKEAALCESVGEKWTVELIQMSEKDYLNLSEFSGH